MKKNITLILAAVLALSVCVVHVTADYAPATTVYSGGFVLYNDGSTYKVIGTTEDLSDENGTIVIPSKIDGKTVAGFGGLKSGSASYLKHIVLPETVVSVSGGGRYIESINLDPNRHMDIGMSAFTSENLKTFTADGKNRVSPLWEIATNAFSGSGIETVILDRSLSSWYERDNLGWHFKETDVFNNCKNLRTVYMTDNVRSIFDQYSLSSKGGGNFANCIGLDYLCFPESIGSLGTTFTNCTSLRTAVFPAKDVNLTHLLLENSTTNDRERSTFRNCPNLTIFGKAGTTVEDYAKEANIPFIGSVINHGEPSTAVAQAAQTATVYINGYPIPAYTLNGSVYVGESNLKSFGFGMDWDNDTRTTTVTKPENVQWTVELNTNPEPYSINVVSSDIKFIMNGFPIPALNVGNGESLVDVNALAEAVLY